MKQNTIWLIAISFAIGFFANKIFEKKPSIKPLTNEQYTTPLDAENRQLSTHISASVQTQTARVEDIQAIANDNNGQLSVIELTDELEVFASNKAEELTFSELSRLYLLVANLPADQVLELLSKYAASSLEDNNPVFSTLFSKYAEANPKAALNFASDEISDTNLRNLYLNTALASIAKKDPIAAYDYVLQNIDVNAGTTNRSQMFLSGSLFTVFKNLTEQDSLLAIDKLAELSELGHSVNIPVLGLAQTFESKEEFLELLTLTESIDDHEVERTILNKWTRHDPEQVAEWLTQDYTGSRYNEIKDNFIWNWSYIDRTASADWVVANTSSEKLNNDVTKVLRNWGNDNPTEAMQWFNQQSETVYNQSTLRSFLSSVAFTQPQFAADNLSSINDKKDRLRVAQSIYQGFKRRSSSKADTFLQESPFREEILKFNNRRSR